MAIHYWLCQCEERLNRNVSMSKSPRRIMDRKWLASHSVISDSYQQEFSASAVIPRPADSSTISTACLQLKVLFLELLVFGMCLFQLHFPLFKRARSRLCPQAPARQSLDIVMTVALCLALNQAAKTPGFTNIFDPRYYIRGFVSQTV